MDCAVSTAALKPALVLFHAVVFVCAGGGAGNLSQGLALTGDVLNL